MHHLREVQISRAQAEQRAGRAGRTQDGLCYRLYPQSEFEQFARFPEPEIQRSNLSNALLMVFAIGVQDVLRFQFITKPPEEALLQAVTQLVDLEAIDEDGQLTELGKRVLLCFFGISFMSSVAFHLIQVFDQVFSLLLNGWHKISFLLQK